MTESVSKGLFLFATLEDYLDGSIELTDADLDRLADETVALALAGDLRSIKAIGDCIDGPVGESDD